MKTSFRIGAAALLVAAPLAASAWTSASAQTPPGAPAGRGAAPVQGQSNTTGNDPNLVIPRGPTGADTATTNPAAGGNAGQPERAVPQGSANGGGSNR